MSDDNKHIEQEINKAFKQAVAFHQMGQLEQASSIYRQLLRINPHQADILHLLGLACYQMGVYGEAVALIGRAVEIQPNVSKFHNHLGSALFALGKREPALMQFKRALECPNPTADAYHNLGVALYDAGKWDESIAIYEKGLKKHPGEGVLLNEMLKNMAEACDWGSRYDSCRAQLLELARKQVSAGKPSALTPYHALCLEDDVKLQHSIAKLHAEKIEKQVKPARAQLNFIFEKGHKPSGSHHALRIGYVSADFRDHPTGHLIGQMLELHSENVEIFVYSLSEKDDSPYRERIKAAAQKFTDASAMAVHQLAQQIYQDKVDILIDVMGYISGAQPELFALRPAPLNVSFLAYPGTMGARFMDYLVTDKTALPDARAISETPLYMPHSYFVCDTSLKADAAKSRSYYRLPEEGKVLASFNKTSKITPEIFACWCAILTEVPESVLWLYAPNKDTQAHLQKAAQKHGVDAKRLIFASKMQKQAHLARYSYVDVFLDCSPVTAHTTAMDALLAGAPVVTIAGNSIIARGSASILKAAGLEELICGDVKAYKALALRLLQEDAYRDVIKDALAKVPSGSALADTKTYVKSFEDGLFQAFEGWIQGDQPAIVTA